MNLDDHLSPNFTLGELAGCEAGPWQSQQLEGLVSRPAHGPSQNVAGRLAVLALTILQPIRDHLGRPVHVNSGFRCPARNAATPGSSATSQHMYGEAADICVPGFDDEQLRAVWRWIAFESKLPFGQVIFEDRRPGSEGGAWIHVSLGAPYRAASLCGQRLTWTPAGYRSA
jgi:zinc D-Ala-D-Ala carboxypeptidase